MCFSNDKHTICGQRYSHLMQAGTRFTFGPQCRTSVQDHIIRNRLTPLKWRKNFEELLKAMYLTQHGAHIVDLMRTKVETGLRARIQDMVNGGLIKEEARNGDTKYIWRADADNFLGLQGWWKDWAPTTSQRLAREAKPSKKTSSATPSRPPKGKAAMQKQKLKLKQSLNGNQVRGGKIGSNAIAGVGRDVNLRQTIHVYHRDDSSSSSSSDSDDSNNSDCHEGGVLVYEDFASEDDGSYDSSNDDQIPIVKTEDHDIVMVDAPLTEQSTSAFPIHPSQPFQYQQFINNCNHSCSHHKQPPNPVVPEFSVQPPPPPPPPPSPPQFPPRPASPAGTPSSSGSSSDVLYTPPSFVSDLQTAPPPALINLSSNLTPPPQITISSDSAPPGSFVGRACSILPQDSASEINLPLQDRVPLRTSIDRRAIRAGLQDWTEEQLLQTIDELGDALIGNMIWRLKVLCGADDMAWLAQDLYQQNDRHLDILDIVCEELDARLGLGYGEGVLALSWWWLEG